MLLVYFYNGYELGQAHEFFLGILLKINDVAFLQDLYYVIDSFIWFISLNVTSHNEIVMKITERFKKRPELFHYLQFVVNL